MILFHRTTRKNVSNILRSGFVDGIGTYRTNTEHSGVWLSDMPLDANEGVFGDSLLVVVLGLTEEQLADFEWIEDGKGYREWLIPAALVNTNAEAINKCAQD